MRKNQRKTKAALPTPETTTVTSPSSPQEGWVGLTRDQLELAVQSATAWLQDVEALCKVQWDMTHIAAQRYQDLQQRLHNATDLNELMALQVEMLRFDSAAAIKSAQEFYDVAVHSATDALVHAKSTLDASQSDALKTWMQSLQSMIHTGVRPLDEMFGNSILRDLMKLPGTTSSTPASATR